MVKESKVVHRDTESDWKLFGKGKEKEGAFKKKIMIKGTSMSGSNSGSAVPCHWTLFLFFFPFFHSASGLLSTFFISSLLHSLPLV